MISRTARVKEAKCNFCFNWFVPLRFCTINICSQCFKKQGTDDFEICSPDKENYFRVKFQPRDVQYYKKQIIDSQDKQIMIELNEIKQQDKQKNTKEFQIQKITISDQKKIQNKRLNIFLQESHDEVTTQCTRLSNDDREKNHWKKQSYCSKLPTRCSLREEEESLRLINIKKRHHKLKSCLSEKFLEKDFINRQISATQRDIEVGGNQKDKERLDNKQETNSIDLRIRLHSNDFDKLNVRSDRGHFRSLSPKSILTKDDQQFFKDIRTRKLKYKIYHYLVNQSKISPVLYRVITQQICDLVMATTNLNGAIELLGYQINENSLQCYLEMLEWNNITVLKLIKVGLTDNCFKILINHIIKTKIETLALSNNCLTEQSILYLQQQESCLKQLKNIYLGNNAIQQFKVKNSVKDLRKNLLIYL